MKFIHHDTKSGRVAELVSIDGEISSTGDALDVMANAGARKVVIRREQLTPDFFDLSTGIAGEILQKCSNYQVGFAIVGDYSRETSAPLKAFIRESNRSGLVLFVSSVEEALERWR